MSMNNCCEKCLKVEYTKAHEGKIGSMAIPTCSNSACDCHKELCSPQSVNDYKKVSTALAPLLEQIFHGENHTSKKIHEEIDTALEKLVAIIIEARTTALQDAMEVVKKELFGITEGFEDVYKKFPAREAALIIKNRIDSLFENEILSALMSLAKE